MTPAALKSAREALGLSQPGFARLLGIDGKDANDTIRRWEGGRCRIPGSVVALLWLIHTMPGVREALENRPT